MIPLFRVKMPPREAMDKIYDQILSTNTATNFGMYEEMLKNSLKGIVGAEHAALATNASLALELLMEYKRVYCNCVPVFTHVATVAAAVRNKSKVQIVNMDWNTGLPYRNAVLPRSVLIVVGTLGTYVDVDDWDKWAETNQIKLVYDFAAGIPHQQASSNFPCVYSLHATKGFNSCEGALVTFPDEESCEEFRAATNFGIKEGKNPSIHYTNLKMDELRAGWALHQLKDITQPKFRKAYVESLINAYYDHLPLPLPPWLTVDKQMFLSFPTLPVLNAHSFVEYMGKNGVVCKKYYDTTWLKEVPFNYIELGNFDNLVCFPRDVSIEEEHTILDLYYKWR